MCNDDTSVIRTLSIRTPSHEIETITAHFCLFQFCVLTVLAMGMYVVSGGWALWMKPRLTAELRGNLLDSIQEYDTVLAYQRNWDSLHARVRDSGRGKGQWADT